MMDRRLAAVLSAVVVVLTLALGAVELRPPAPASERAPAAAFSAARAKALLDVIAQRPRPIGSAAHDRARVALVRELKALGLETSVERAPVVSRHDAQLVAVVRDVIARLPGREAALPPVLLVAHYDSVAAGPGAADDASGVAVVVETVRALAAGPRPARDVLVLLSDGEEDGLLGSTAFARSPRVARVGAAVVVDNAGAAGPSVMYETSAPAGALVRALADAPAPLGSSLIDALARRQYLESDFTPLRDAGVPVMAFGLSEGFARDHTAQDSLAHVDLGSLQQQGEQVLAATRRLASDGPVAATAAAASRPDHVYFPLAGRYLVVYSRRVAVALTVLAGLAAAGVAAGGLARRRLNAFDLVAGLWTCLLTLVFTGAITLALWAAGWAGESGASSPGWASDVAHRIGLTLVIVGVGLAFHHWALDEHHTLEQALATWLWWLALAAVVTVKLPAGAYLLTWPLLAGLAAFVVALAMDWGAHAPERPPFGAVVAFWMGAVPALLLFGASIYLLFMVSEMRLVAVLLGVWLLLGTLQPLYSLFRRRARLIAAAGCFLAGVAVLVGLSPLTGLAADPTAPPHLFYVAGPRAHQAAWGQVTTGGDADTVRLLAWHTPYDVDRPHTARVVPQAFADGLAPALSLAPPSATLLGDTAAGGRRHVILRLSPPGRTAVLTLLVTGNVGTIAAACDGLRLPPHDTASPDESGSPWHVDVYAPPARGVALRLSYAAGATLRFRLLAMSRGLPGALRSLRRPEGSGQPGEGDATVVETSYTLGPGRAARLAPPAPAP